jgi:hypothetical protein
MTSQRDPGRIVFECVQQRLHTVVMPVDVNINVVLVLSKSARAAIPRVPMLLSANESVFEVRLSRKACATAEAPTTPILCACPNSLVKWFCLPIHELESGRHHRLFSCP